MDSQNFLVVEDDAGVAKALARVLSSGRRRAVIATTVREAVDIIERMEFIGAVIDLGLPDGTGFDVLKMLRSKRKDLPALVITGNFSRELANRCQLLDAEFMFKPAESENLRAFANRAASRQRLSARQLATYVAQFSLGHELSRREREVLDLALQGQRRADIARELGLAEATVKMQIRSLLRKTGHRSVGGLIQQVLSEAWVNREDLDA